MMTQMKKRIWGKTIGLLFAQCLLLTSIVHANTPEIRIPSQYGTVKEVSPMQAAAQESGRMIIHIQDAHCNYEAQKNMAQVLDYLVREHNLNLIMVEGGSGNVSLSFLRGYSDKKARVEVADKYLKEGKISGEEYLDIVSDYKLNLYGIDDDALYDAHLAAFEKIDSIKEQGLRDLEGLSNIINDLKPFIYSEELRQLEKKSSDYAAKTFSLAEYCQYLKGMADTKGLNLKDYPHLTAFSETARLEKEIDFQQAELQRNTFIKDLANLLDEAQVKELINKSQEFKAKKLTSQEYYSFLQATGEKKLDLEHNYPQLHAYITYITVSKDINAPDLLKEVTAIEEKIKETCFVNNDQKKLNEISKSLQILTRILNLELTPEDYEYFKANQANFLTASWINFLNEGCKKYNLTTQLSTSNIIDENLNILNGFYQLGVAREKAFMKNMVNKMDESGQNLAVLITGGFHTPGVTQMLKDKGYSYIVVAPVITQKSDSSIYFSVLREEKKPPVKALEDFEDIDGVDIE
jgi:hypothetical protein